MWARGQSALRFWLFFCHPCQREPAIVVELAGGRALGMADLRNVMEKDAENNREERWLWFLGMD